MIRIDSRADKHGAWIDGFDGEDIHFLLRDDANGYVDRPTHRPGVIGEVTDETGDRMFHPMGGDGPGEALPLSVSVLAEILHILTMPVEDLKKRAQEDDKHL